MWSAIVGLMSPMDYVRVTSTQAARIFNIYPQKGIIEAGADADVIVLDPSKEHTIRAATHHSRMDTNIYENRKIKGKVRSSQWRSCLTESIFFEVVVTISRGRVVWENEKLNVQASTGRFIPMAPFPYLYKKTLIKTAPPASKSDKEEL